MSPGISVDDEQNTYDDMDNGRSNSPELQRKVTLKKGMNVSRNTKFGTIS